MRILVVGANGVVGRSLVPRLVARGHRVIGTSRSPDGAAAIRTLGGVGEVLDIYDQAATADLFARVDVDVLISQVSDLPDEASEVPDKLADNARVRREAVPQLVRAAAAAGIKQILVQSVAWNLEGEGGEAIRALEDATLAAGGVVLRYGRFYGPGTHYDLRVADPAVSVATAASRTIDYLGHPAGTVTITE